MVTTCPYGINYIWLDTRILVFGFIVRTPSPSAANKKMMRRFAKNVVAPELVETAKRTYAQAGLRFSNDIEHRKREIIDTYVAERRYEIDYLQNLKPEIQRSLSFFHDYKQFIAQVRQNINVVLEARYPNGDLEDKLARALPAETAIYWASILMEEKLKTAFLLMNPERIVNGNEITIFRLHGLVTKYVRIYQATARAKQVNMRLEGTSNGDIKGNPTAIAVIPHTLIDNALKYAPRGTEVRVAFEEDDKAIGLRVTSLGPEVAEDEKAKIFELFYRGRGAQALDEEGAGFGLYLAQFVAKQIGANIEVSQGRVPDRKDLVTTFSVRFRRER